MLDTHRMLIQKLFIERISKKTYSKTSARGVVVKKSIFRLIRSFYTDKINLKNKHSNKKGNFFENLQAVADSILLNLACNFIKEESLSVHLGALIYTEK